MRHHSRDGCRQQDFLSELAERRNGLHMHASHLQQGDGLFIMPPLSLGADPWAVTVLAFALVVAGFLSDGRDGQGPRELTSHTCASPRDYVVASRFSVAFRY